MKKLLICILPLFVIISVKSQTTLDTAVNFSVKDVNGNTLNLFNILDEGKIVVIDFFSANCGPCQYYAPDMQLSYEEFGCNDGNVFVMGIDKGNTNQDVLQFDSIYGIQYPNVSGMNGGGNQVHKTYNLQSTPTVVVIAPDRVILVKQIYPPDFNNIVDSVLNAGGIPQECITSIPEFKNEEILTINPNPVKDFAYLNFVLEFGREVAFQVYNITGQKIIEFEPVYYPPGKYFLKADLLKEPEGFYFVRVLENNIVISTKKLILLK
ncbi:MAG: redoxin domain-containing protein [Bacteroidales bacterium]|nr:redoxin domain-containing protein [Bacteroidales bacterium]